MGEIKLWAIGSNGNARVSPLASTDRTESENLLEDTLVKNPSLLMEDVALVGRQTRTAGGSLDLLGVDGDGRLVVFELKRGTLSRAAVAQIIDYASSLDARDPNSLYEHIATNSGKGGIQKIDDFEEWFSTNRSEQSLDSLTPPRMVLVGLGADSTTERMVNYLVNSGTDISLLTFYGFEYEGKTLLARHLEALTSDSQSRGLSGKNMSRAEKLKEFDRRAKELDISALLNDVRNMIREQFHPDKENARVKSRYRSNFNKAGSSYLFIEIVYEQERKSIKLGFHPQAVDLALDEFNRIEKEDIPVEKETARNATHTERVKDEIKFPLYSDDEWESRKKQLTALTRAVSEAYRSQQSG